jgi:hypothetical protein
MWISKVLYAADLSIDTRRELGLGPRPLAPWRSAHIGWLLKSHDGLFYYSATQSLHNFVVPGAHIIRRPVDISLVDDGLTIFNLRQDEYALEMYGPTGDYTFTPGVKAPWATELRVIHLETTVPNEGR